jgi:ABC-type transport system substrate-binding protein
LRTSNSSANSFSNPTGDEINLPLFTIQFRARIVLRSPLLEDSEQKNLRSLRRDFLHGDPSVLASEILKLGSQFILDLVMHLKGSTIKRSLIVGICLLLVLGSVLSILPHLVMAQTGTKLTPTLHITLISPTSNPVRRAWASIVQNNLNSLGINASLVYLPFSPDIYARALVPDASTVGKTYDEGGFDTLFVGYNMGIDSDPYSLYHSSQFPPDGQNYYLWNNTRNDNLTTLIKTTVDSSTRNNYVKQWQELAYDELPSIPILYTQEIVPFDSKVVNGKAIFSAYHYPAWPPIEHLTTQPDSSIVLAQPGQTPGEGIVPELSSSYYDLALSGEIFSSLALRNDTRFKTMVPELASGTPQAPGWSVAADGKTWTVNLRQGVKWHDGQPFTATDVKFTFDLYLNSTFGAVTSGFATSIIGTKDNVVVTGPYSVQFNLPAPYAYFVQNVLSTGILPEHILNSRSFYGGGPLDYSRVRDSLFNHPDTGTGGVLPVGTGPYKWSDYNTVTTTSHLIRNDNYFNFSDWGRDALLAKGEFTVKDLYVRVIVGTDAAITALTSGEVDILDSQYHFETQPSFLSTWSSAQMVTYDGFGVQELGVNMRHPILGTGADTPLGRQDPSKAALAAKYVRQAISHAIPRLEIINTLLNGYGTSAITTPVLPLSDGFNTQLRPYEYNLTRASELLQLAGYNTSAPDFTLSLSKSNFIIQQGASARTILTLKGIHFTGLVQLNATISPVNHEGLALSFTQTDLILSSDKSTRVFLRILVGDNTPTGDYVITITGTANPATHSVQLHVTVQSEDGQNQNGQHRQTGIR